VARARRTNGALRRRATAAPIASHSSRPNTTAETSPC
jgi:hypothetical protein